MHTYTLDQKEFIKANIKGISVFKLVDKINKRFDTDLNYNQIRAYVKNHKLTSGHDTQYKKGHNPTGGCIKKGQRRGVKTEYKKGVHPHNWVPVGAERITTDGYIDIKVQDGHQQHNWKAKHKIIWEKANGPIPKGNVVIFANGDNRDFDIDNLLCITKHQLLVLNRKHLIKNNSNITKTSVELAKLYIKIAEVKKKNE